MGGCGFARVDGWVIWWCWMVLCGAGAGQLLLAHIAAVVEC